VFLMMFQLASEAETQWRQAMAKAFEIVQQEFTST
jgi:hypothetical protein